MKRILLILLTSSMLVLVGCDSEKGDWEDAQAENTSAAYQTYLDTHPQGKNADEAGKRLRAIQADKAWEQAQSQDTVAAYRSFRQNHPNSRHAADARQRMSELRQAEQAAARNQASSDESLVTAEGDTETMQNLGSDIGAAAAPVIQQLETLNDQIAQAETALSATPASARLKSTLAELEAQRDSLEGQLIDMAEARDRGMEMQGAMEAQAEEATEEVEDEVNDAMEDDG